MIAALAVVGLLALAACIGFVFWRWEGKVSDDEDHDGCSDVVSACC